MSTVSVSAVPFPWTNQPASRCVHNEDGELDGRLPPRSRLAEAGHGRTRAPARQRLGGAKVGRAGVGTSRAWGQAAACAQKAGTAAYQALTAAEARWPPARLRVHVHR